MTIFIHITDARMANKIMKIGIRSSKIKTKTKGVYCFPLLPDYHITHQWARELRRNGIKEFTCIKFKIPDDEMVLIGKYNSDKINMKSSEACDTIMKHIDPMGLEIIIQRRVLASEIMGIYPAPKIIGWRYYPSAKGKKPFCNCKYCNRGEIRAQRLIQKDAQQGDTPEPASPAR